MSQQQTKNWNQLQIIIGCRIVLQHIIRGTKISQKKTQFFAFIRIFFVNTKIPCPYILLITMDSLWLLGNLTKKCFKSWASSGRADNRGFGQLSDWRCLTSSNLSILTPNLTKYRLNEKCLFSLKESLQEFVVNNIRLLPEFAVID